MKQLKLKKPLYAEYEERYREAFERPEQEAKEKRLQDLKERS